MITEEQGWQRAMQACLKMVKAKNHDYDASWRRMRAYGISDVIANKIDRVRNIENMTLEGREPLVSEGIESDMQDILNYAVFYLIKIWETREPKLHLAQIPITQAPLLRSLECGTDQLQS